MHNKNFKNLEFGQKLIIIASLLAIITALIAIHVIATATNLNDFLLMNTTALNLLDFNLLKALILIIALISISTVSLFK